MRTHNLHVLMCTGPICTEGGVEAEAMFHALGEELDARPELRIKRTRTHCLVACRYKGPILVVYPDGVWYRCADKTALERIVAEHLEEGREVSEYVFHRTGTGDIDPAEDPYQTGEDNA